jgi:hypothetical protein
MARRSAIGAAVGFCSVFAFVVFVQEARFFCTSLAILGTGGIIGGAICGATIGALDGKIALAVAGFMGGIGGCGLAMLGTIWYSGQPWPSPKPLPASGELLAETTVGSWGYSEFRTYTITLPLNTVQQHYETEMSKYCIGTWQFEPYQDEEYAPCVRSGCQIRRWGLEQFFEVHMCAISETESIVSQVSRWQD